jgi:hypothetical protein
MKKTLIQIVGIGAFIVGGLLARESAIEGIELVDDKVRKLKNKTPDELPPA